MMTRRETAGRGSERNVINYQDAHTDVFTVILNLSIALCQASHPNLYYGQQKKIDMKELPP